MSFSSIDSRRPALRSRDLVAPHNGIGGIEPLDVLPPEPTQNVRTVIHIADDRLLRELLHFSLPAHLNLNLLNAATGRAGLDMIRRLRPSLVLLGLGLSDMTGFAVAAEICRMTSPPSLLILTSDKRDAVVWQASHLPLDGFLWKEEVHPDRLWEIVASALAGRGYFSQEYSVALNRIRSDPHSFAKFLTDRELELLPVLGYGCTDEALSRCLGLGAATIRSHRKHIMGKLSLHRTEDLMRWTVQHGFCDLAGHCGRSACPRS